MPWFLTSLSIDSDFDGLICAVILLRAQADARVHLANRNRLASVLSSLDSGGERVFIADLSVNRLTWPAVEKELARLVRGRAVEWYNTHEVEGTSAEADPRLKYARLVLKPRSVSSRLVHRAYGDARTERLAMAAEMADQRQHANADTGLWNQVYPAHIAVSAYSNDTAWLVRLIGLLSKSPEMDLRDLPEVVPRAELADKELREALADLHDKADHGFEGGLVAVWIDPDIPETVRNRRSPLTGKLAQNRTAIVAFAEESREDWLDVRGRRPWFWDSVNLRALDKAVEASGGFGSGGPGATHWDLLREAVPAFVDAVRDLAPSLHGTPRGQVGGVPPKGLPKRERPRSS